MVNIRRLMTAKISRFVSNYNNVRKRRVRLSTVLYCVRIVHNHCKPVIRTTEFDPIFIY